MGLFNRNKDAGTAVAEPKPGQVAAPAAPDLTSPLAGLENGYTPLPRLMEPRANVVNPNAKPAAPNDAAPAPAADASAAKPATPVTSRPLSAPPRPSLVHAAPTERQQYLSGLRVRIHQQLVEKLDIQNLRTLPQDTVRGEVRQLIRELCQSEKGLLSSTEQERLMDEVMDETFGLGPLESLLKDPTISDILVNRFDRIYCERKGRLELSEVRFRDNAHLRQVIDRIVGQVGRRIDETQPMADARLADGSRVNAIIPPLSLDGCAMSIRRFGSKPMQLEDLIRHGAFPQAVMDFLAAAVQARANIVISGGTGSGKTTLLNCLSRYISADERVITLEDAAELQLQQPHVVRLETRPANIEGKGEVTQRDLVKNCLRMRPDRVIIGECRGGEALDMMQAMNTGHEGSMTTIHANNPRDAIARLEVMVMMAGYEIPVRAIRQQISSAVNIIVQANRLTGGRRKVTRVTEVSGMEGEQITMQDLFVFHQTGVDEDGHAVGSFECTGMRPRFADRIEHRGIRLPGDLFTRRSIPAQ
jgi:pilus assembly protein CpaF